MNKKRKFFKTEMSDDDIEKVLKIAKDTDYIPMQVFMIAVFHNQTLIIERLNEILSKIDDK